MNAKENGLSQTAAAAKAGVSVRSGRRIEKGELQPQRGRPHDWRTRPDPLREVWESELVPMLERQPQLQAMTLFEYLQDTYPGQYPKSVMRTLQRRVQNWRVTAGPPKTVMFALEHPPGEMGLSDFTHFKQAQITIAGEPFEHLLYHYRLAYSGWQYVQVIQGGESFVALAEGLQNALQTCGGSPKEHRTDSLSAAYRNRGGRTQADLTQAYQQLCRHYNLRPTRNNRGVAHENGAIEAPHGHFKNRLHQALLRRESADFASVAQYQALIDQVMHRLNQGCQARFEEEVQHLQPLPIYRCADYEVLSVKVGVYSTIRVRRMSYSVPSQLIGCTLTIHLHHDRLVGFLGRQQVVTLPRLHAPSHNPKQRLHCVNYRHLIDSLRLKPAAFLYWVWQQDLLPNDNYRQLWQQIHAQFDSYTAARLMCEALYIAAKQDKEHAVAQYLTAQLETGSLSLVALQQQFHLAEVPAIPTLQTQQHALAPYDELLHPHVTHPNDRYRDPQLAAQIPQTALHETAVARTGTSSPTTGVDPCSVSAGAV